MDRRRLLAVALGTAGAAAAVGVVGVSQAMTAAETTETTDPIAVEPAYGAGLFDVDPPQGTVSQDPNVTVVGDVTVLSEDQEF